MLKGLLPYYYKGTRFYCFLDGDSFLNNIQEKFYNEDVCMGYHVFIVQ